MKTNIYGALLIGTFALAAQAQQQSTNTNSSSQNLPPGLERREQLPPGLSKRDTLPPGLEKRQGSDELSTTGRDGTNTDQQQYNTNNFGNTNTSSNRFSEGWNRAGTNMARWGTNAYLGASNAWTSLSNRFKARTQETEPTGSGTNRVYGSATNTASASTGASASASANASASITRQDQAVTAADRKLLVNIRQEIQPILVNTTTAADVHFIVREGVVTLVGVAPTVQESRRIVEVVQQTPGVTRVVNQIRVGGAAADVNVGTFGPTTTTTTTVTRQDRAITPADRKLLVTIREEVQPVLVSVGAAENVYFHCHEGVVTLVGSVPSPQQTQRIVEVVQRTPGVVRVVNQIQVNAQASAAAGATSTNQFAGTNATAVGSAQTNLGGTSLVGRATSGTNNAFGATNTFGAGAGSTNTFGAGTGATNNNTSTNLSPTGRTNTSDRIESGDDQNLPPGLQKRETLPPGLEKRSELPPGLEKRGQSTNAGKAQQSKDADQR